MGPDQCHAKSLRVYIIYCWYINNEILWLWRNYIYSFLCTHLTSCRSLVDRCSAGPARCKHSLTPERGEKMSIGGLYVWWRKSSFTVLRRQRTCDTSELFKRSLYYTLLSAMWYANGLAPDATILFKRYRKQTFIRERFMQVKARFVPLPLSKMNIKTHTRLLSWLCKM